MRSMSICAFDNMLIGVSIHFSDFFDSAIDIGLFSCYICTIT